MRSPFLALLLLPLAASASESPLEARNRIEAANALYDQSFDYYAELCAATQYRPIGQPKGNGYGHAFLLVKGACLDTSGSLPRVKFCESGEVGVSVDSNYDNVKWTAAPTRSFALYADVPADHAFSPDDNEIAVQKAVASGMFKGVRLIDDPTGPQVQPGETYEHMVARWSLGTNFGMALSRNLSCVRVPLVAGEGHPKEAVVKALIYEMNRRNDLAQASHSNWSFANDNCTDTAVNQLAAVGFYHPLPTDWSLPSPLKHPLEFRKAVAKIAIPYDEMLGALLWGNDAGPASIFGGSLPTPEAQASFANLGWIGAQPGVIVENIPVHATQNTVFETDTRVEFGAGALSLLTMEALTKLKKENLAADLPNAKARLFQRTLLEPRYTDLRANLEWWRDTYAQLAPTPYVAAKQAEVQKLLAK